MRVIHKPNSFYVENQVVENASRSNRFITIWLVFNKYTGLVGRLENGTIKLESGIISNKVLCEIGEFIKEFVIEKKEE